MDTTYGILKLLHIIGVIAWVGGSVTLGVIYSRLQRTGDHAALGALTTHGETFGRLVIGPSVLLVLITGIVMVRHAGIGFHSFWVSWGFVGLIGSFLTGGVLAGRARRALERAAAAGTAGDAGAAALRRRISILSGINVLLLLSVLWAMVLKPGA